MYETANLFRELRLFSVSRNESPDLTKRSEMTKIERSENRLRKSLADNRGRGKHDVTFGYEVSFALVEHAESK